VPNSVDNMYFTQSKQRDTLYAFWTSVEEAVLLPSRIAFPVSSNVKSVSLLGSRQKLAWKYVDGKLHVEVPKSVSKNTLKHSAVFKVVFH
jgi:alpha-L-fucosidase